MVCHAFRQTPHELRYLREGSSELAKLPRNAKIMNKKRFSENGYDDDTLEEFLEVYTRSSTSAKSVDYA
jgi:hypothetical protein